ncbi:transposase [Streptomyces sp. NPDC001269]
MEARLRKLVERLAPSLLAVPGCGVLGAAVIIGETAGTARFKSKDAFAPFTGTAPIPVRSSHKVHVRLNRGGNRAINHALQMIAVTQVRRGGEGAGYFDRQLARGKTPKEAVRLLRRRISDHVFLRSRSHSPLGRGSQYTSFPFTAHLLEAGIDASIGAVGNALDNALMESQIALYKTEPHKPRRPWHGLADAELDTAEWVDWFAAPPYRHRDLPPHEHETNHCAQLQPQPAAGVNAQSLDRSRSASVSDTPTRTIRV